MILGRDYEQAEIVRLISQVRSGEGRSLVISGEPGIGKTTLLDWTATRAKGLRVLRAGGRESEADLPFVAIGDLLRPIQDEIGQLPRPQARALGSALAVSDATADRLAVNAAVLNLLARSDPQQPSLVLIDDYHWLDSASRQAIDFVARRTQSLGIGLVLTTRGRTPADYQGKALAVSPLPTEAATALVSSSGSVHPEVMQRIVQLAAGNPLALVELPLGLTSQQLDGSVPLDDPLSVPETVERAFLARLQHLSDEARRALLCAAEESDGAIRPVLKALKVMGLAPESLMQSVDAELVAVSGTTIRFRHPLVRSVVHQTADSADIRLTHLALAEAAEDDDRKAWHLAAAAIGPDEMAAVALEGSARRALDRGAAAPAAAALERAADLSVAATDQARRIGAAARAAHLAGDMTLTSSLIVRARQLSEDGPADSRLLLLEADIRMRRGDFAGACSTLRLEAGRVAAQQPSRAATMLLLAAKLRVYRFEAEAAVEEVDQALALVPEPERDVLHLTALAMSRTMAGEANAKEVTLRAMEAAARSAHGHTHTLGIGWPLVWQEEYEKARGFIARAVGLQREGGHLAYLPQALLALAELDFRTGRWDQARVQATESHRLYMDGEQPTDASVASALLARLEAACGEELAARRHALSAEESDAGSGLLAATAYARAARGLLDLGQGRYLEAIGHLMTAREITDRGGIGEPWLLPLHADLAEALVRSGNRDEAHSVATELFQEGQAKERSSAMAAGLRCMGLVASDDSYASRFEQALAIHRHLPTPFELARTELCYGERLRRGRRRLEARSHLRHALTIFESLGAEPWSERCRSELVISGETVERPRSIATLTPQERQVAAIVASGATNREAAAALFVSPKTIEFHLGNVYRKMGLRSRTELANAVNRDLNPQAADAVS